MNIYVYLCIYVYIYVHVHISSEIKYISSILKTQRSIPSYENEKSICCVAR